MPKIAEMKLHNLNLDRTLLTRPVISQNVHKKYPAFPRGLIFYKDYTINNGLQSNFNWGSGIRTFTASRSVTTPATYIDSAGIVQLTTQNNVPRNAGGYYNETGFHTVDANGKSARGLLIETTRTNRLTKSMVFNDVAWTATNITADDADAGSTAPDGSVVTSSLTASAGNGTIVQAYVDAVAEVYTASIWLKRKTGTGTINLRANVLDSYTAVVVTSAWARFSVSSTSLTNPAFGLQIVTDGDAVYAYGAQLEKNPYATSFIPTTTAELTRNAELLSYLIINNRTTQQETIFVKLVPMWAGTNIVTTGDVCVISTNTKNRKITISTTTDDFIFYPNLSDSSTTIAKQGIVIVKNNSTVVCGIASQVDPNASMYQDGVLGTTVDNDDFVTPAWGNSTFIGSSNASINQLNGLIQKVAIFNRALTASEVLAVSNNM